MTFDDLPASPVWRRAAPPVLISVSAAAKILGVSPSTIRTMIVCGSLEAIRVNSSPAGVRRSHWRVKQPSLDRFLGRGAA